MKSKRTKSLNVKKKCWVGGMRGITPGALDLNPGNNMYSLYVWTQGDEERKKESRGENS